MKFIGIEGGGTTWVAAIGDGSAENIVSRKEFVTEEDPSVTLGNIRQWLHANEPFDAIGVASFGPIDAKKASKHYGFITTTPKKGWRYTDVIGLLGLRDEYKNVPFEFDTDVNAPAMAEFKLHGNCNFQSSCAYITVGTGVGVGLVVNGKTVHGLVHPEGGHLMIARHNGDEFLGTCPYHGNCVEGLCSTGSLASRSGCTAIDLPLLADEDPIWDYCAAYLGQLCANLVLIASPEKIKIGGGVLNRQTLYPKIRKYTAKYLNEYIQNEMITTEQIDNFISPSIWGSSAGIVGAVYLAVEAFAEREESR